MKLVIIFFMIHAVLSIPRPQKRSDEEEIYELGTWKPLDFLGECGVSPDLSQIVGGTIAKPGELPFMAIMAYSVDTDPLYLCGGVLINKWYVLTAAHCQSDKNPIQQVILGEHELSTEPDCNNGYCLPNIQKIYVDYVITHEKFRERSFKKGFDIALVRLETPAVLFFDDPETSVILPVCLPWTETEAANEIEDPLKVTLAGWGATTNDNQPSLESVRIYKAFSRTLQKLDIVTKSVEECEMDPNLTEFNSTLMRCAGEKGKDSCKGDSGGPMLYRRDNLPQSPWFAVGIVSYGFTDCGSDKPSVYTRVSAFLEWIESNLET